MRLRALLWAAGVDRVKSPNELLTRTQRQDELADMIGTTGSSLLGLTVGCARCHDHKFDPIPQRDYYALQAVFAGVQHEERPLRWIGGKDVESERLAAARPGGKRPPVNPRRNKEAFRRPRCRPCVSRSWPRTTMPSRALTNWKSTKPARKGPRGTWPLRRPAAGLALRAISRAIRGTSSITLTTANMATIEAGFPTSAAADGCRLTCRKR